MATNLEKLRGLLQELFQLDQADLDFGIYRIMNQKRDEVVRFLDKDLLPQVQAAFKHYKSADKSVLQGELDKAIQQAESLGVDPESTNKVKELRKQLAESAVDVTALENEVFSHLFNFFRRYYSEGDFISLRRYKEGVYAIPYEGEEVKLHWANADQYYVKSSETFRDYTFKVPGGKRVRVHLVAASTEQDNNKPAQGKERRFVLAENPLSEENGELFIRFEYRPHDGKEKQDELNKQAIQAILKSPGCKEWATELGKLAPTDKNRDRTVLEKHLFQYTARNTFDYFIHKDLGGFLRRELDFFIKNEVMHLDDIEHESAPKVEQYLSQIKVIRSIAHKIIQFLEQLENFQKKLWLKKKFVIETNYCMTLDRVPEELYPEIAKNDAQREEWVRLFAIDEIKKDLNGPGYSKSLSPAFLKAHKHLLLDTAFFPEEFKAKLWSKIADLSGINGLLIHADNFHALNLIGQTYGTRVKCVYIDPPYNTGSDGFTYKDSYQHSSWITLMQNRVNVSRFLLSEFSAVWVSIDDREVAHLRLLLDGVLGSDTFVSDVAVVNNFKGRQDRAHIATAHEHVLLYAMPDFDSFGLPLSEDQVADYDLADEKGLSYTLRDLRKRGGADTRAARPGLYFPLYWNAETKRMSMERSSAKDIEITPKKSDGSDGCWRWGPDTVRANLAIIEAMPVRETNKWNASYRVYLENDGQVRTSKPKSLWFGTKYSSDRAIKTLRSMIPGCDFASPKSVEFIKDIVLHSTCDDEVVLDYFAGSGTTAQAVLEANRGDKGNRVYILSDSAPTFDTILRQRVAKALYSAEWDNGKPVSRDGTSQMFKYIRLESYEDALNNLALKRTGEQQTLLDADAEMREQYILSYMLDVESRGSQSLLNIEAFRNPDEYKLRAERNGETQLVNVDLVETFNWLLGLTVKHIDVIRGVRVVEGTAPNGDRVLVLWRNIDQMDSDALDKWFQKQDYNTREMVYDVFYVNGDNNLENLRRPDQTWKVRLIEEEFQRIMFDVQDV